MGLFPAERTFVSAALDAVRQSGQLGIAMQDFTARDRRPAKICEDEVCCCDIYLGLIGFRYGTPVADRPELSYTELEFETATNSALARLAFLMHDDAVLPAKALHDPDHASRQMEFRKRLMQSGIPVSYFRTADELQRLVRDALDKLLQKSAPVADFSGSRTHLERHLLFGVLAVQLGMINHQQFTDICVLWSVKRQRSVPEL